MTWIYEHGGCRDPHVCMLSEFQNIPKLGTALYLINTYSASGLINCDELRFLTNFYTKPSNVAFQNIYSLRYMTIPDTWTTVSENLFRSSFTQSDTIRIIVGKNVKSAGTRTFFYQLARNANTFCTMIMKPITPPTLSGSNFIDNKNYFKIYVPDESVDLYKEADQWSTVANNIYPISECPPEHLQYHDLIGGTMQI